MTRYVCMGRSGAMVGDSSGVCSMPTASKSWFMSQVWPCSLWVYRLRHHLPHSCMQMGCNMLHTAIAGKKCCAYCVLQAQQPRNPCKRSMCSPCKQSAATHPRARRSSCSARPCTAGAAPQPAPRARSAPSWAAAASARPSSGGAAGAVPAGGAAQQPANRGKGVAG